MASNFKYSSTPAKPKNPTISKVRVIARVRPFLDHETASKKRNPVPCVSILDCESDEVTIHLKDPETSRSECYKLDGYFGQEDNNVGQIYEKEVKSLIPGIFSGCNATVFAYGATGSGKTFTMQGSDEQQGLMPLAMSTVLSICQETGSIAEISYYEVYLDKCYDLLDLKPKEISVLDDKEGQIHLRGLSHVQVNSMSEFHEVFARGIQRRKVAHTSLNDVSSRSHGVLVITASIPADNGLEGSITGKLNLIDLAGNEDNKRSGNEGIRLQESAKINQSLFSLSNVIYALNNNKTWVPYRESKLTRILQDSLGGSSHALMVACLNPGEYQEAVHTVSLAARSRHISNVVPSAQKPETPKVKIDMDAKLQAWLESKGKTKSAQKRVAFGSPFFPRTPGHGSSFRKHAVHDSCMKAKASHQGTPTVRDSFTPVPQRKLFDFETMEDFGNKSVCLQKLEGLKDCPNTNEVLMAPEDPCLNSHSAALDSVNCYHCLSEVEEAVAKKTVDVSILDGTRFQSTVCLSDELLEEDEKANKQSDNFIHSPPNRSKIRSWQSPQRKALSQLNSNISRMPIEEVSSRDNVLSVLLESSTPKTPYLSTREKLQDFGTPLDKYNARSSKLKSCLIQEYVDFLNSATREELVELKGIGVKRAEYIIELRKTSPLKSLSDLEKIGLSSKQVLHMFTRAAKGIFE